MRRLLKYGAVAAMMLMLASTTLHAQNYLNVNLGYNVGIPAGSFRSFIDRPSFRGFNATLSYPINAQWNVGLGVGYNDYYQKFPRQTYDDGKGNTISAVVSNSVQLMPLLLQANYTVVKNGFIRPYVGAGAGVNFITSNQYLGEFGDQNTSAKLALKGEAGVYIPLSDYSPTAIKIGGSYNYSPYDRDGIKNLSTWGLEAGIRFAIH